MKKKDELTESANKYQELVMQIKEFEKQANPLKKKLTDYAKEMGLDTLNIGKITIEKRTSEKLVFEQDKCTPDWLYRFREEGGGEFLKIAIDKKAFDESNLQSLVCEVGGDVVESVTYAIRV